MKKLLLTAVSLLATVGFLPIYADCPPDRSDKKPAIEKKAPVVHKQTIATPPEPFWHDLHWFE